ncbi:hypothetical protein ACHAPJ_008037 [Fusarium lateritium]
MVLENPNLSAFKQRAPEDDESHEVWDQGLGAFDVFSLIVNKMIGTGIYTAPTTVYLITGKKSLTLGLFGIGFLYCLMSTAIYIQYAEVFPYNGGELVYLGEIAAHATPDSIDTPNGSTPEEQGLELEELPATHTTEPRSSARAQRRSTPKGLPATLVQWYKRLTGDGLLAYIIYSIIFIVFFNSATNSMQFGRMVLMCIEADKTDNGLKNGTLNLLNNDTLVDNILKNNTLIDDALKDYSLKDDSLKDNHHLIRYIGVTTLSVICLIQFFNPGFGRKLNRILAVIKIGFLLGLIIVGLTALSRDLRDEKGNKIDRAQDWREQHETLSNLSFAKALIVVLFSFEGWENATFVAGEIPRNKHKTLRLGFISAVCTVGTLYLLVVAVVLTNNNIAARRAWPVVVATSSFGSLNAIIYTFSRVKQVIRQAEVLPWSRYLKQDDCLNRTERPRENAFHFKSPQGGLVAHWLSSVIWIAISASIHGTSESTGLPGYIQTYVHCFVLMILGMGYYNLKSRDDALTRVEAAKDRSSPGWKSVVWVFAAPYVLLNMAILIINAIPKYVGSDGSESVFPGYGYLVMLAGSLLFATVYYVLFFGAARHYYEPHLTSHDSDDEDPVWRT